MNAKPFYDMTHRGKFESNPNRPHLYSNVGGLVSAENKLLDEVNKGLDRENKVVDWLVAVSYRA